MDKLTTIVTITVPPLRKRPAFMRKPVLRFAEGVYLVGYRSSTHGFFAIGHSVTLSGAWAMYVHCNGPELFNSWNNDKTFAMSFRHPLWQTPPVQKHVSA